jgi:ketosteroid isomerase-like protein
MSRENVEVVQRLFDAVARRDTATVLSLYDRDVEWDGSRHRWAEVMGDADATFRGHAGLRSFFQRYYEMWEDFEDRIEDLIDAGDRVISVVTSRARGRASGLDVEWTDNVGVWTIRDGKVIRVVWFPTREEAPEAVGLSE